jgi:hypothetical protein
LDPNIPKQSSHATWQYDAKLAEAASRFLKLSEFDSFAALLKDLDLSVGIVGHLRHLK